MIGSLLRPWTTARTWRAVANAALDLPISIITFTVVVTLLALSVGLLIVFPLALPVAWLLFAATAAFGGLERSRAAALLDVDLAPPHAPLRDGSWFNRLVQRVKSKSRWRELLYFVVLLPVGTLAFIVVFATWAGSLALAALPLYVYALPGHTAELGLMDVSQGPATLVACLVGIVGLAVVAPWATVAMAALDRRLATALLAPAQQDALAAQVTKLEASRVAAVDSAEAERRRIERDLHDGAQQRLVKLGMDLGMANERFDTDPVAARALVADAHEEAKAALAELRDLVRGFHPAILEDRGLDAALSAVVARTNIPVTLQVDLPVRPSPTIESTAYFVVVEALTNVSKHARATKASVSMQRRGDRLAIEVADDGIGGAVASPTGGLAGLDDRVRAVGGWLQVLSPPGGPTTVLVELPCAS